MLEVFLVTRCSDYSLLRLISGFTITNHLLLGQSSLRFHPRPGNHVIRLKSSGDERDLYCRTVAPY